MRLSLRLLALTATFELSSLVTAGPLGVSPRSLTKTLIFDAPGLSTSSGVTAQIRSYVYLKTPLDAVAKVFEAFASSIGSSIGDSLSNLEERIELFATLGLADQSVDVKVSGCSKATVSLGETPGLPNPGMQASTANLGTCSGAALAGVDADNSNVKFTVYPTAATGWGVISDIDDTIKNSYVLDLLKAFEATFLDEPNAVSGMPQLYASLSEQLSSPEFLYLSGSPFQLYPMLRPFIDSTFPPGPILLQNLTALDIPGILSSLSGGVEQYKLDNIDAIHSMFPGKQYLGIGDSTQSDPEVYGQTILKYGVKFMPCAWIRMVDGANNTQARFEAAFKGVPSGKWRTFKDPSELADINVANGQC